MLVGVVVATSCVRHLHRSPHNNNNSNMWCCCKWQSAVSGARQRNDQWCVWLPRVQWCVAGQVRCSPMCRAATAAAAAGGGGSPWPFQSIHEVNRCHLLTSLS